MILVLTKDITEEQKGRIRSVLFEQGCIVREISDAVQNVIGAVGGGVKMLPFLKNCPE